MLDNVDYPQPVLTPNYNTVLCDCCQSPDHAFRARPVISAPKPTMVMYGLGHEELMFWEMPLSGRCGQGLDNRRVTISDGQMKIDEIIAQLKLIVPDDVYQWDVYQLEDSVYRLNFPSKMDLICAQHFGKYNVSVL